MYFGPPRGPERGTYGSSACVRACVRAYVRACVHASRIRVVLCVRDSAQTTSHICTYLVPINYTLIVDVQHTFNFDLDLISDPGQCHKNFCFLHALSRLPCCISLVISCTDLHAIVMHPAIALDVDDEDIDLR